MATTKKEVNPVVMALKKGPIKLTVVHNRMIDEETRIFLLHY